MTSSFYKLKRHRLVSGVLAGLVDKFGLSVTLPLLVYSFHAFSYAFNRCGLSTYCWGYDLHHIRMRREQENI